MNDVLRRATARTWVGLAVLVLPMLLIAIDGVVLIFALADHGHVRAEPLRV